MKNESSINKLKTGDEILATGCDGWTKIVGHGIGFENYFVKTDNGCVFEIFCGNIIATRKNS